MRPIVQEKWTIWESRDRENFSERIRAPRPLLEGLTRKAKKPGEDRQEESGQKGVVMKGKGTRRATLTRVVPAQRRAGYQQE